MDSVFLDPFGIDRVRERSATTPVCDNQILLLKGALQSRREIRRLAYSENSTVTRIKMIKKAVEARQQFDPLFNSDMQNPWKTSVASKTDASPDKEMDDKAETNRLLMVIDGAPEVYFELWTALEQSFPVSFLRERYQLLFRKEVSRRLQSALTTLFRLNLPFEKPDNLINAMQVLDEGALLQTERFDVVVLQLWADGGVREAYEQCMVERLSKMPKSGRSLKDSAYILQQGGRDGRTLRNITTQELIMELPRVMEDDYIPSHEDRLLLQRSVTRMNDLKCSTSLQKCRFVGIDRLTRRKGRTRLSLSFFDCADSFVFVADASSEEKLRESIQYFNRTMDIEALSKLRILVLVNGISQLKSLASFKGPQKGKKNFEGFVENLFAERFHRLEGFQACRVRFTEKFTKKSIVDIAACTLELRNTQVSMTAIQGIVM